MSAAFSKICNCSATVVAAGGSGENSWAAVASGNGSDGNNNADRPNTTPTSLMGNASLQYHHDTWDPGNHISGVPASAGESSDAPTSGLTFSGWAALHLGGDKNISAFQDAVNKAIVSAHATLDRYASAMGIRGEWSADDLYKMKFTVDIFLAANDNPSCNNGCIRALTAGEDRSTVIYMPGVLGTNATFEHLVGSIIHEFRHTTGINIALQGEDQKSGATYFGRKAENDAFDFEDAVMQYYKQ